MPRALLVVTLSTAALVLWSPATTFARDSARAAAKHTEQGRSLKTALMSAGVLRRGSGYASEHGSAAVRGLQLRLRTLGFRPGPIDGLFGPLTQAALERFQVARGLIADGVAGPHTKGSLLRSVGRERGPVGAGRSKPRAAPEPRTSGRSPARDVTPPGTAAPVVSRAPAHPRPSDGLGPEVSAGLGAIAMALLLGGAWLLGGRRRRGTGADTRAGRGRAPATGLGLGMVCAALLAVFAMGAAAGALFVTHASPDARQTEAAHGAAAINGLTPAGGTELAAHRAPQRSPNSP